MLIIKCCVRKKNYFVLSKENLSSWFEPRTSNSLSRNSNQLSYSTSLPIKKLFYDKINLQVVFFYKQFFFISGSQTKLEFTCLLLKVVQLPSNHLLESQTYSLW